LPLFVLLPNLGRRSGTQRHRHTHRQKIGPASKTICGKYGRTRALFLRWRLISEGLPLLRCSNGREREGEELSIATAPCMRRATCVLCGCAHSGFIGDRVRERTRGGRTRHSTPDGVVRQRFRETLYKPSRLGHRASASPRTRKHKKYECPPCIHDRMPHGQISVYRVPTRRSPQGRVPSPDVLSPSIVPLRRTSVAPGQSKAG
jgi:hypothetical protein